MNYAKKCLLFYVQYAIMNIFKKIDLTKSQKCDNIIAYQD